MLSIAALKGSPATMGAMKQGAISINLPESILARIGKGSVDFVAFHGVYARFAWQVLKRVFSPPWRWKIITEQCVTIGIRSLPVAALTSIFVGMVMVLQTGVQLVKFGSKNYVPGITFIALTREMVPAFCSMVIGARVAASITAEIGTMRVTEQIDAMDLLNVDPMRYLCAPRVIAMTLILPMISGLCIFTGYLGGMLVANAAIGIEPLAYFTTTLKFGHLTDVYGGIFKTIWFGLLIAMTGCYYGFNTQGGAAGVGRATTQSVVQTMILILTFDYILTTIILAVTGLD